MTSEELADVKQLIPPHLHKWIDYDIVPEADDSPTPGEALNEVPLLWGQPGSHSQFPESYFKKPKVDQKPKVAAPLVSLGEVAPKATLNPKPGLNAKKSEEAEDSGVPSLLDLALSDE
jgi:hypothetical protein